MTSTNSLENFQALVTSDNWTIAQVGENFKQYAAASLGSDESLCCTLLTWLDRTKHVGRHVSGRRFTRVQFIENVLSRAGIPLTLRDFGHWFEQQSAGDWRPNDLLPYLAVDPILALQEQRIDQLEHELHQMEVTANRARAEVNFVVAERDHYYQQVYQQVCQQVGGEYQQSASWRVTKPLRDITGLMRRLKAKLVRKPLPAVAANQTEITVISDETKAISPGGSALDAVLDATVPWRQPGYSTEIAWRGTGKVDDFDRNNYREWVQRYAVISESERADILTQIENFATKPFISVLMQVINPQPSELAQAVDSVFAQIYPHWQLCIAVADDCNPAIVAMLRHYAEQDARIVLVFKSSDEAQAATTLNGLALGVATGSWLVLLEAIDFIAIEALFMMASVINNCSEARFIYSDDDKISTSTSTSTSNYKRIQPNFKPEWNVDLFYSQNYTQHLCAYEAALVRGVGGFQFGMNDAASFDLSLRCLEHIQSNQIKHLPYVLYHKRMVEVQDALTLHVRTQNLLQGELALNAHFKRRGINAKGHLAEGGYRVKYGLPATLPLVSLIIPTKNNTSLLAQCISSILQKTSYTNYEILIIDNGSDKPETLDYLKSLQSEQRIHVIRDNYVFNYSALNNAAVKIANGELIALVNDDIEVKSGDWLEEMVSHALRPGIGAVGARLWYPDHTLQHAGMVMVGGLARHVHKHLPMGGMGFHGRAVLAQEFSVVTGACLVVKKSLFESVGGLNEVELAIGFNDVDLCLRLGEAGYHNVWTPYAELYHHESATRGQDDTPEKQRRAEKELRYMRKRWGNKLHIDPAYSPNLTDGHDDFSFAWPPRVEKTKATVFACFVGMGGEVDRWAEPISNLASVFCDYAPLFQIL